MQSHCCRNSFFFFFFANFLFNTKTCQVASLAKVRFCIWPFIYNVSITTECAQKNPFLLKILVSLGYFKKAIISGSYFFLILLGLLGQWYHICCRAVISCTRDLKNVTVMNKMKFLMSTRYTKGDKKNYKMLLKLLLSHATTNKLKFSH